MLCKRALFYFFAPSVAFSFALLTGCGILTGCGSSSHAIPVSPVSPAAFSVTAITPSAGTTNVPANATIQITFSSAADPATVNATNIQVTDPNSIAGTVAYTAGANTATFTPSAALAPNITYSVTVTGVTSSAGTAMAGSFTSKFATIAAMQYQASLFSWPNETSINGQVSLDTVGNVTVQLTGATASTTFTVQFCPAYNAGDFSKEPACINTGSVSTDAAGNGSSTAMFPQPGSWAGDFQVTSDAMMTGYATNLFSSTTPGTSAQVYMSTLQPENTVNGTGITRWPTQSPLTSGAVTYANGSVTFTLTGASPDTLYETAQSETVAMDSSGSYGMSAFTTDGSGDATSTEPIIDGSGIGDLFEVEPAYEGSYSAGYVGGFSVPK
jgi:Big-like domain-containing protein